MKAKKPEAGRDFKPALSPTLTLLLTADYADIADMKNGKTSPAGSPHQRNPRNPRLNPSFSGLLLSVFAPLRETAPAKQKSHASLQDAWLSESRWRGLLDQRPRFAPRRPNLEPNAE